jgi:hypothetical protein
VSPALALAAPPAEVTVAELVRERAEDPHANSSSAAASASTAAAVGLRTPPLEMPAARLMLKA